MQTQTSNTLHNAIMEAGSKDRPPMLAPGNYVQWKSRIKRYIDTKPNHDLIHHCLKNPSYKFTWADKEVLIFEGSPVTRTESHMETYKTVSQDIREELKRNGSFSKLVLLIYEVTPSDIQYSTAIKIEGVTDWHLEPSLLTVMSSASSAVTYTSVYTDLEPGRVFWGADEELSDGGSSRVIVYEYDGLPMLSVVPPSLDYIPGHEEPQTPLAPQDKDEHEPMFIQPHDPDFPLPPVVSPTVESPKYVAESDLKEDPEEYEDDKTNDGSVDYPMDGGDDRDDDDGDSSGDDTDNEDKDEEDGEEEEEHLAPADSAIVIPTDEIAAITFPPEAEVDRLLAMPTPSPSPFTSVSPPSVRERLARCTAPAALPSPPLPPPLHMPPPIDRRDDIPKTEMPPRKRLCLSTLGSSTLDAEARRRGIGEIGYGIRDTWVDPTETVPDMAPMTVGERVDLLMEDRITYHETIHIVEEETYTARKAWSHSIGLSQAVHFELQTHQEQVRQAQMVETLRVMGDMRREMGDMQAKLLALREQPRRARQPGGDARVPNHQDAPRDANSYI
nr:hypothetical protein [Tanacetum cinerariifolium]